MRLYFKKSTRVFVLFSLLLVLCITSCDSKNYNFYIPEIPFESGLEELGSAPNSNIKHQFELFKYQYILNFSINKDEYLQTTRLPKTIKVKEGEELSAKEFYDLFLDDKNDVNVLIDIIDKLSKRSIGTDFDLVQVLVNFVQSIPYEEAKKQKYPIETLYLMKGDCSDKSILLAKLLDLAGFNVCLFEFKNAKHMAVGIATDDNSEAYRLGYIYIESTGYNRIGNIPDEFVGGIKINEEPVIITINEDYHPISGFKALKKMYTKIEKKYGAHYFNTTLQGKIIIEDIFNKNLELKSIKRGIELKRNEIAVLENKISQNNCSGVLDEKKFNLCSSLNKSINKQIVLSNKLIENYNLKNNSINNKISLLNTINKSNYIKN